VYSELSANRSKVIGQRLELHIDTALPFH